MPSSDQPECPFCRDLNSLQALPPDTVVWEFPHSVAFLGTWQYYQGYCILVARRHVTELFHLEDEVRREYMDEMCILAKAIFECFQPAKLNYELLGNQVPHLHWHIFPRYADDRHALQPVWQRLARVARDEERQKLESGKIDRHKIVAKLREILTRWLSSSQSTVPDP
jgi:diadenosine tetraphosphate (Ap4A) HIT family hydrolase